MPHTNTILVDNMTNKKLTLICLTMIIILIAPSINAISVNKTTNESIKPEDTGTIFGWTGYCHWPGYSTLSFVRVWIGTRFTISDLYGHFSISGLSLDRHYTVYYTRWDYVTKSEEVFLSSSEPEEEVDLMFNINDKRTFNHKSRSPEETTGFGSVYGQVRYSPDGYYGDMPAFYTLVRIGNKFDFSSMIDGSYEINGLPLDQTYAVVYSCPFFKTKTTTVTLTTEEPNVELYLFYYTGDEKDSFSIKKIVFHNKLVAHMEASGLRINLDMLLFSLF